MTAVKLYAGLRTIATSIEKTAKDEIGEYQPEVGSFPAWEPLAESTKEDRARQGFPEDEPLLRTGELRDSITHQVEGLEAVIGSESDVAAYQELGTSRIPPRPFLGPAAVRNETTIRKAVGTAAVLGIAGKGNLPAILGYDFKVEE